MGERAAIVAHMLRAACPTVAEHSDRALLTVAQAMVDELAAHNDLEVADVASEMVLDGRVPLVEAASFVAAALATMTPGPHGRCRVRRRLGGQDG